MNQQTLKSTKEAMVGIEAYREEMGWTRYKMAAELGVSNSSYSAWYFYLTDDQTAIYKSRPNGDNRQLLRTYWEGLKEQGKAPAPPPKPMRDFSGYVTINHGWLAGMKPFLQLLEEMKDQDLSPTEQRARDMVLATTLRKLAEYSRAMGCQCEDTIEMMEYHDLDLMRQLRAQADEHFANGVEFTTHADKLEEKWA